jgi:biotin-dependent carboxylase-like uncharacterized protein
MIEVLSNGALNVVQDMGRKGHLSLGVSGSGAMDAPALQYANMLLGNNDAAAGIEICIFPFRIKCHQAMHIACAGAAVSLDLSGKACANWAAFSVNADDVLTIAAPLFGARVMLAVRGGIDVPHVLGSRSTDLKSGFGGVEGRGLRKGDRLAVGPVKDIESPQQLSIAPMSRKRLAAELVNNVVTVRALAGSEYSEFTPNARSDFAQTKYTLTPDCNRQGYRLEGVALETRHKLELLSHGVVPGTIQVPPSGQPIVQMAEANTLGGYPKIATVIGADLWRLAQMRTGQAIRFEVVDVDTAVSALRENMNEQQKIRMALADISAANAHALNSK